MKPNSPCVLLSEHFGEGWMTSRKCIEDRDVLTLTNKVSYVQDDAQGFPHLFPGAWKFDSMTETPSLKKNINKDVLKIR